MALILSGVMRSKQYFDSKLNAQSDPGKYGDIYVNNIIIFMSVMLVNNSSHGLHTQLTNKIIVLGTSKTT